MFILNRSAYTICPLYYRNFTYGALLISLFLPFSTWKLHVIRLVHSTATATNETGLFYQNQDIDACQLWILNHTGFSAIELSKHVLRFEVIICSRSDSRLHISVFKIIYKLLIFLLPVFRGSNFFCDFP